MSPGNPFVLGSSDNAILPLLRRIRKLRWVFLAVIARRTSSASDHGFSLRHFPASACHWVFPAWVFALYLVSAEGHEWKKNSWSRGKNSRQMVAEAVLLIASTSTRT